MSKLTERILFLKFVRILKFVKIREFQEFLKFIKFEVSIYVPGSDDTHIYNTRHCGKTKASAESNDCSSSVHGASDALCDTQCAGCPIKWLSSSTLQ